jgi:predicted choloylglycine hydrolase
MLNNSIFTIFTTKLGLGLNLIQVGLEVFKSRKILFFHLTRVGEVHKMFLSMFDFISSEQLHLPIHLYHDSLKSADYSFRMVDAFIEHQNGNYKFTYIRNCQILIVEGENMNLIIKNFNFYGYLLRERQETSF